LNFTDFRIFSRCARLAITTTLYFTGMVASSFKYVNFQICFVAIDSTLIAIIKKSNVFCVSETSRASLCKAVIPLVRFFSCFPFQLFLPKLISSNQLFDFIQALARADPAFTANTLTMKSSTS
jgi:hypothetical protein